MECSESDEAKLEFDHEDGAGNKHRHELFGKGHASPGGWHFCVKLRQLGFPQDLHISLRCTKCHDKRHPNRGNPFAQKRRVKLCAQDAK